MLRPAAPRPCGWHSGAPARRRPSAGSGGTASAAARSGRRWPANSTLAIGTPLARLFFEPQKTMAISSSREKPRRRLPQVVPPAPRPSSTHIDQRPARRGAGPRTGARCPSPRASLKASRPPAGSSRGRRGRAALALARDPAADPAAQRPGRRRTAAAAAARCAEHRATETPAPCALQQQARPAAASARCRAGWRPRRRRPPRGTLPRAIEVKAIDDCTVEGSTQGTARPRPAPASAGPAAAG